MQEFINSNNTQFSGDSNHDAINNHAYNHSDNKHSDKVANNGIVLADPLNVGRAIMAASFAAPLIARLHRRNIVFHVYGLTPEQETALLSCAMSVWGNPKKLIFSYSDGCDYLTKKAGLLCNLPLAVRGSHLLSSEFAAIHAPEARAETAATADTATTAEPAYSTITAARAAKTG